MSGLGDPETIRRNGCALTAKVIAAIACIMLLSLCNVIPTAGVSGTSGNANGTPDENAILSMPYYNQGDTNWCLYYSLAMMYNYNNHPVEPWEIAEYFNSGHSETFSGQYNPYDNSLEEHAENSYSLSIRKTVWGYNLGRFDADKFNALVRENIDRGQPILMAFQYETPDGTKKGHAVVATGYDDEYIYLTDPSGAITGDVFGVTEGYIAVPVMWDDFNERLVNNIMPANLAFTIEILDPAPDNSPEGSIYMTDRSNSDSSCLIFTDRYNINDIGLLRLDGSYENGYTIASKGNVTAERKPSSRDAMSVYFTVANPTATQKEYTVKSNVINITTGEVLENFFFKTNVSVSPFSSVSKGVNYSNQLGSVPPGEYRIILTLRDENMRIVDSVSLDLDIE